MRRMLAVFCALVLLLTFSAGARAEESEDAFLSSLAEQGFPESYFPSLLALHRCYPNWVFRAQKTGLVWETVLDAESAVGTSLVPTGSLASWKSCEKGAYDPATGSWFGLDGASWVAASREMVAYCLDPRNALNADDIFQFENLAYSDTCNEAGVRAILAGTFMADWTAMFMEAGRAAGVSPYHLASRARQEQGTNGNGLGRGTVSGYAGYYNIFNINAYATSTLSAVQNGARYAATTNATYHLPWTSPELAIQGGAVILGNSYINREQNTLYLQKFDVTDGDNGYYRHQYMTNILAPSSEATTLSRAYSAELKAGAMEFCIPVYDNMPEHTCIKPDSAGDNNNLLTVLSVEGQTLTPTFSMYTVAYDVMVDSTVTSVSISATTSGGGASVSGINAQPLHTGTNMIPVTVTAASGATRTYTLTVYRAPSEGEGDGTEELPPLNHTSYRVEDFIRGVEPDTAAADFLGAFSVDAAGVTLSVVTAAGLPATGTVGTGHMLQLIRGDALIASYPVIIRGEVSGDGAINSLDLLKIQKHILGVAPLSAPAAAAADANGDGTVNSLDLLRTQRTILGLSTIDQ